MALTNPDTARADTPVHVAIIMDGNGRWARSRGLPRTVGHRYGAEAVRRAVQAASELGISYLTLFGFSSENWKRPVSEISDLMGLLRRYLQSEIAELHKNGVRLHIIGERAMLAQRTPRAACDEHGDREDCDQEEELRPREIGEGERDSRQHVGPVGRVRDRDVAGEHGPDEHRVRGRLGHDEGGVHGPGDGHGQKRDDEFLYELKL